MTSPAADTVCYCFGHTVASIRDEVQRTGRSTVVADVTAHVRAGTCACTEKHPEARCCLGDVRRVVKELLAAAHIPVAAEPDTAEPDCCAEHHRATHQEADGG